MNTDFIRAEIEGYGGRLKVMSESWIRIEVDRSNTSVEVMANNGEFLVKAVGRMGTIVDVIGMLAAGEHG